MKRTLADNEFYQIKADDRKQRLYITLKGFWRSPQQVPQYLPDIQKAIYTMSDGFTCLANFSMLMPFSEEVKPLFTESIKLLLSEGMKRSAQLLPLNLETSEMLANYFEEAGFKLTA
ncbi:MAG: hypothetical protein NZ521_10770, partial [Flammeovirgaceae bacterium]|nr:hypothetical protein [Flammeovirgaceae bacterium]MDW8288696.1 hypothetical protein [Flammeovirgaceae bacterium]